ncbi:hypothetical protein PybrP1_001126 [[Pythium] brassicae (nom. inval.)]|nr:hypothetical protein PybrP1_001126 [[Pythium] brassicae (nom. inval.)]
METERIGFIEARGDRCKERTGLLTRACMGELQAVVVVQVRLVDLVDRRLDDVVVLRVEVQRRGEEAHGVVHAPELLGHLPHHKVHRRLARRKVAHDLELGQRLRGHELGREQHNVNTGFYSYLLVAVLRDQHVRALEARLRVQRLELARDRQHAQRLVKLARRVEHHAEEAVEQRAARVDRERALEMVLGELELFLPVVDCPEPVPRVVVPRVGPNRVPVAVDRLLKVLVRDVLVPGKRVRVRERRVELDRLLPACKGSAHVRLPATHHASLESLSNSVTCCARYDSSTSFFKCHSVVEYMSIPAIRCGSARCMSLNTSSAWKVSGSSERSAHHRPCLTDSPVCADALSCTLPSRSEPGRPGAAPTLTNAGTQATAPACQALLGTCTCSSSGRSSRTSSRDVADATPSVVA